MTQSRVDLDAVKAARTEATGESPVVVFGGKEFKLPAEMPYDVIRELADLPEDVEEEGAGLKVLKATTGLVRALLGDQWEEFERCGPSVADVMALASSIGTLYGVGLGEAPASRDSSTSTSKRSRLTSNGSTGSASAKSAGGADG